MEYVLPGKVPIVCEVHLYRKGRRQRTPGWIKIEGQPDPDPIHRFIYYHRRHKLHHSEMKEYSVLLLQYIDVESTEAMARYLMDGGFAVVSYGQLRILQREIQKHVSDHRLQAVKLGLEHPLFRSFYDITDGGPELESINCLELDGRLIAVTGVRFVRGNRYTKANKLFVNVLAYGLIQPSKMGRYLVR